MFSRSFLTKQDFWKNRLVTVEDKNRGIDEKYIYIYKVWQKRKAQTLSNCRRRFSTNFSSFHSRNICNIFLENRFAIVAVSTSSMIHVETIGRQRRWFPSLLKLFETIYIYINHAKEEEENKSVSLSINVSLSRAAILLPRTNERTKQRERKLCSLSRAWKSGSFSLHSFYGFACTVSRISAASFKTPLIVNGP